MLKEALKCWGQFIEITERRNLFVHTDGSISRQYIQSCTQAGTAHLEPLVLGDQLGVSLDYYRASYECLVEVALRMAFNMWRSMRPSDVNHASKLFNDLCLAYLSEGKYQLARKLLDFAVSHFSSTCNEEQRKILIINQAQAYKWSGLNEDVRSILEKEDWSATNERFKLALAVLEDRFDDALETMKILDKIEGMGKEDYREWPLFKDLRKQQGFQKAFSDLFGEPLDQDVLDPDGQAKKAALLQYTGSMGASAFVSQPS